MTGGSSDPTVIRLTAFVAVFVAMGLWEVVAPHRPLRESKSQRWTANLSLVVLDTLVVYLFFPVAALGMASLAAERGFGFLALVDLPLWASVPLSAVVLDLAIYLQHLVFHAAPTLWRLHRVHHADLDFDVTTALRFHPLEMILSMIFKLSVIAALGPPVLGVLLFEVLLNGTAMFNHGNVRLPARIDRVLRSVLVTPDMHRIHHSVLTDETHSNFGFCLSLWDRLFATYRAESRAGRSAITIGIESLQDARRQTLGWLLRLPLVASIGSYPMGSKDLHDKDPHE